MNDLLLQTIIIGISVSIDALAVSIASGLKLNSLKLNKLVSIPITFGLFQCTMTILGYALSNFLINNTFIFKYINYIAFLVLVSLGLKMIFIDRKKESEYISDINFPILFIEGISTSIDALSIGLTLYKQELNVAIINSIIIGFITFTICMIGIILGKYYGIKYRKNAFIYSGIILIIIGFRILLNI